MQLHDFAVASGLAETVPEFGRHLRATTETFLALTGDASSGSAGDSERGGSAKHDASVTAAHDEQISSSISEHTGSQAPTEPARAVHGCQSNWEDGGLAVVHEPATGPAVTANIMSSTSRSAAVPISDREDPCRLSLDHQSFPVGETPSWPDLPGAFPGASPRLSLHPPDSYASMEITFGRQLQRIALERGLILISMPNAPPTLVSRVFGFCLLFETPDDIISRLTTALGRTAQQCLYNWQFPFFHLGGAGTHLDAAAVAAAGHRIGNRGTADVLKPAASAGFATGPFSPRINEARDHQLDPGTMRMALPGFTGDFLDADEAEIYLFQRGVAIPPGADFVTVDIDPNHFDNGEWAAAGTGTLPHGSYYPAPVAAASSSVAASGSPAPSLGSGCAATVSDPSLPDLTAGLWPATAAGAGASLLEPLAMDGSVPHGHLSAVVASPAVGDALQRGGGMSGHGAACDAGQPSSLRRVVVDVQVLARGMRCASSFAALRGHRVLMRALLQRWRSALSVSAVRRAFAGRISTKHFGCRSSQAWCKTCLGV